MVVKIKEVPDEYGKGIPMNKMQPLQVGVIIDKSHGEFFGHYVMRTASEHNFEVIDLSVWKPNYCWIDNDAELRVRLLDEDKKLVMEVSNVDDY